jgi:hypothetical protein
VRSHYHTELICDVMLLRLCISWTKYKSHDITLSIQSIMCNVPFVANLLKCSLVMAYKLFFKSFVTIPVAAFITDLTTHFLSNILCLYLLLLLLLLFWSYSVLRHNLNCYHILSSSFGRHSLALFNDAVTKVLSKCAWCLLLLGCKQCLLNLPDIF